MEPSPFLPFLSNTLECDPCDDSSGDLSNSVVLGRESFVVRLFPLSAHEINYRGKREGCIAASGEND